MSNIFQWQLHGDGKTLAPGEVVEPDERLTWVRTAGIGVVPELLRTLVFARPCGGDQFAAGTVSPSLDMSR